MSEAFDSTQLNIRDADNQYLCPVCGFPGAFRGDAFDKAGGLIGKGICPCCLFEPGFDDVMAASGTAEATTRETVLAYRRSWTEGGMKWRGNRAAVPPKWNAGAQVERLLTVAPELL